MAILGTFMFTQRMKAKLGIYAKGRTSVEADSGVYQLREATTGYEDDYPSVEYCTGTQNVYLWDVDIR